MRLLPTTLLLLCCAALYGQATVRDIVLFEGMVDYPFPNHLSATAFTDVRQDYCQTRKLLWLDAVPTIAPLDETEAWAYWVHQYVTDSSQVLYRDHGLTQAIWGKERKELFCSTDTVINCYSYKPPGYEIYQNPIHLDDLVGIRVQQKVSWNSTRKAIEFSATAYAPLTMNYDENGNFQGILPLAWVPIIASNQQETELFSDNTVPLVITTATPPSSSAYTVNANNIDFQPIVTESLQYAPSSSIRDYTGQVLSVTERETLITPSFNWSSIENIQLYIRWHWDAQNHQLYYKLIGWSPLKAEYDEYGEWMYAYGVFYQVVDER